MTPRDTADRQLERLLHILPAATREGGVSLARLAEELGVSPDTVRRDIEEVVTRSFYHPAGGADRLQIHLSADRVRIWTSGQFRRPVRLTPREALAVGLGLRVLARDGGDSRGDARTRLRRRIENQLAAAPPPKELEGALDAADSGPDPEGIRDRIIQAARDRRVCRIRYLKAHAGEPEPRRIHPLAVIRGQGAWYTVAWAENREAIRIFRLDRIMETKVTDEPFRPPDGFDPEEWVTGRSVFQGQDTLEVVVRYSARIARWIREREMGDPQPDGSLLVRHQVMDPVWIVRRVLQYGGDAVVVEPEEVRRVVRATAEGLVAEAAG